jgi:hypothetical protein
MTATVPTYSQAESYLETRAYNEGITVDELLDMTPTSVSDHPVESMMFWQQRDYSHKLPVSLYPEMADDPDNAMPEDSSVNRQRGADIMTSEEEYLATLDNEILATEIDISYSGDVESLYLEYVPDTLPFFGLF